MLEDCLLILPHLRVQDVRDRLSDFLKGNFTNQLLSENSQLVHTIEKQENPTCNEKEKVKKKNADSKVGIVFNDEEDITNWIDNKYSKHGYMCSICNVQQKSQGTLDIHVESNHNKNIYNCPTCDITFLNRSRKILHENTVHKGLKSSPCDRCGMILYNETSLKRHKGNLNCTSGKRIGQRKQGTPDEEVTKRQRQYKIRQQQYNADRKRVYCELCDYTFLSAIEYKQHKPEHRESGLWRCNLPGCVYTAQKLNRLLRHKQRCEFNIGKETQNDHSIHNGSHIGEKTFVCSECGKAFSKSHLLKIHIRSHTGEKPFICFQCDKSFSSSGNRRTHSAVHIGKEQFPCSQCHKSFSLVNDLDKHIMTHQKEKTFTCSKCEKSFAQSSHLRVHKIIHTGEKPFACPECGKAFSSAAHLKRHMPVHTGGKLFLCSQCDKSFSVSISLKLHLVSHTTNPQFSIVYNTLGKV